MIRPLLFAIVEYLLCFLVLRRGKIAKYEISVLLFFLASYQFGEFITFLTGGKIIGLQIAYFSTTLLPALGILLVQKITSKKYGYMFFQGIGGILALIHLVNPMMIGSYQLGVYCIQVLSYTSWVFPIWASYYQGTVVYLVVTATYNIFRHTEELVRRRLKFIVSGILFFELGSIFLTKVVPYFRFSIASLMCAMALVFAFILAKIALDEKVRCRFKIAKINWN